jgi:hypothetical protein
MDCFTLLILLATIAATPAREHDPQAVFPAKSKNWELADAVAELRDPRSTALERQVARERLEGSVRLRSPRFAASPSWTYHGKSARWQCQPSPPFARSPCSQMARPIPTV